MPEKEKTSSKATGQEPQETTAKVADATTTPAPSKGQEAVVQEHKVETPPELTDEQVGTLLARKDVQTRIFREAQSLKDKMFHQEQLRRQQEEEKRRIEQMDDEEYGSYMHAEQKRQSVLQQGVSQVLAPVLEDVRQQTLATVSNKKLREEMATKHFDTLSDFQRACATAEVDYQVNLRVSKREKELREAITKELQAEQAGQLYPQLGRGEPTARESELHGENAIAAGVAAELAKKHKE